ncbi:hypothetical protein COP1_036696 [Malus domestica]
MLSVDHSSWDYWGCRSCLSDTVLNAESLTILNLEYVTTTSDDSIWLPSLKSLSLDKVQLSDLGFFHFFSFQVPSSNLWNLDESASLPYLKSMPHRKVGSGLSNVIV